MERFREAISRGSDVGESAEPCRVGSLFRWSGRTTSDGEESKVRKREEVNQKR